MCLGSGILQPTRTARSRHPVVRALSGICQQLPQLLDTWLGTSPIVAACRTTTARLLCTAAPSRQQLQLISSRLAGGSSIDILEPDETAATAWIGQYNLPVTTGIRVYDPPWYMDRGQLEASGVLRPIRWYHVEAAEGHPALTVHCSGLHDKVMPQLGIASRFCWMGTGFRAAARDRAVRSVARLAGC